MLATNALFLCNVCVTNTNLKSHGFVKTTYLLKFFPYEISKGKAFLRLCPKNPYFSRIMRFCFDWVA